MVGVVVLAVQALSAKVSSKVMVKIFKFVFIIYSFHSVSVNS